MARTEKADVTAGLDPSPRLADAVILGGGASGLSLAAHLAAGGWGDRRVLVVDDRRHADRGWAYWSRGDGLLDRAAPPGTDRFRVSAPGSDQVVTLDRYRYRTITAGQLRDATDRLLAGSPGFARVHGTVVGVDPQVPTSTVRIRLPGTRDPAYASIGARWVFDSTGLAPGPAVPTPRAGLRFRGHRVETDHDAFDPSTPTLMDFCTDQSGGVAFVYVLPTSPRAALVEYTRFDRGPAEHAERGNRDLAAHLDTYLCGRLGVADYRVVGTESGTIPLATSAPLRSRGPVIRIGTPAGMVKASTGYGFERIQRHSVAITRSLVRRGHPDDVPGPRRWHRALDALLLDVVRDDPAAMPSVFARLFAANPGDRVLAFLDEVATPRDELALYRSLPVRPFRHAMVRRLARRSPPI
ncbi:MAG TPA: lycopene cyclase family protein [Actinotalea sp.]|nr:lycopene cyclase family protein [Actinotalea sp.]